MKTSDFPSYTHENIQGVCQCPLKITIQKDGGSIVLPFHASRVVEISVDGNLSLDTDVFVYGLA